jgi:SAM-dependent methyltransferase
MSITKLNELISFLDNSLVANTFIKLSLGNYKGLEEGLKSIYIKKLFIKREEKLSFTYRYKTRDIVKNYSFGDGLNLVKELIKWHGFRLATFNSTVEDMVFELKSETDGTLKRKEAITLAIPSLEHDKKKNRLIEPIGKRYLFELGITDLAGNVFKNAQDKYKQINHYIELLSLLLKELPGRDVIKVADMGAGKGYLTFAFYDYMVNVLKLNAKVSGIEARADLVELCNEIAQNSGFEGLNFIKGSIEEYDSAGTNALIALHACDTATDDAIFKGISSGADLIVVAPCCHKQVRREMEKHKAKNELDFLLKYGIFLERQAEMVTDGTRALILEYFGYSTKVFEFISDAHTPKNVMITGLRNKNLPLKSKEILGKIKKAKEYFGIGYHHLERIAGLE